MPRSRLSFPACARNRDPILEVLQRVLPERGRVLEVASGSGEHAVYFAPRLSGLTWQPSDPSPEHLASIRAWREELPSPNLLEPVELDVTWPRWPVQGPLQAVVAINLIHVAPRAATPALMQGASRRLEPGGVLYLYGALRIHGLFTSPSNQLFDASLRSQNSLWGVREFDEVVAEASAHGLNFVERVAMPANNFSVIFQRPLSAC